MKGRSVGQTAVEVVISLPLLLLFVLGLIQYALVLQARQVVNAAAWRGARAAAVGAEYDGWAGWDLLPRVHLASISERSPNPAPREIEARLRDSLAGLIDPADAELVDDLVLRLGYSIDSRNVQVDLQQRTEVAEGGVLVPYVQVEVHYRMPLILPLVDQLFDGIDGVLDRAMTISADATLPVEPS